MAQTASDSLSDKDAPKTSSPRRDVSKDSLTLSSRNRSSQWNRKPPELSMAAYLEQNLWFQNLTLLVIVINALWICVDVEYNHPSLEECDENHQNCKLPLEPTSVVIENIFCCYFFLEVAIRFFAFEVWWKLIFDGWFVFDGILVAFMVVETWIVPLVALVMGGGEGNNVMSAFSSFRLLRLLRLTRMARIMRFFPELMTLVKGMVRATKAVFFILLFLVLVMYVFAIVFTSQLGEPPKEEAVEAGPDLSLLSKEELIAMVEDLQGQMEEDATAKELFATIGDSMMTLFTNGVLGDNLAQTLNAIKAHEPGGIVLMWTFVVFMMVSSFTLLNMLIGVLCQVIDDCAHEDEEQQHLEDLQDTLANAFNMIDQSHDGVISQKEWENIKQMKSVQSSLKALGVEESQLQERLNQMQESLFGDRGLVRPPGSGGAEEVDPMSPKAGLSFEEFSKRVIELRWDTPAGALDLEMLKSMVRTDDKMLKKKLDVIEDGIRILKQQGAGPSPVLNSQEELEREPLRPHREEEADPGLAPLRDVPTELLFHVLKTRETQALADTL